MRAATVSVVIPTYNREQVLAASIDSVLAQTFQDFELIVVDDGSVDNTELIMQKYIADERVKYIKLEKNAGVSNARNVGAQNASGEWIAFHDSDDQWRPEKLEKQMTYINQHSECGMVYSAYEFHMINKENVYKVPDGEQMGELIDSLLLQNRIGAPTIVVNKELFFSLGGFDRSYPALEDWDFAIKASLATQIGYIDDALVDAHYTEGSVSRSGYNYYQGRCMLIASYKEELEKRNLFDVVVMDVLKSVENEGNEAIELVKNMLMKALLEKM